MEVGRTLLKDMNIEPSRTLQESFGGAVTGEKGSSSTGGSPVTRSSPVISLPETIVVSIESDPATLGGLRNKNTLFAVITSVQRATNQVIHEQDSVFSGVAWTVGRSDAKRSSSAIRNHSGSRDDIKQEQLEDRSRDG